MLPKISSYTICYISLANISTFINIKEVLSHMQSAYNENNLKDFIKPECFSTQNQDRKTLSTKNKFACTTYADCLIYDRNVTFVNMCHICLVD